MCAVHPTRWLIWKYGLRRSGDYFLPASFVSSLADCSWLKVLFPEIGGQNSSLSSFSDRYREIDESVRMAAWATAHAAADTAVHSDDTRRAVLRSALFYGSLPGKVRLLGEERPINRLLLAPTRMLECLADSKRLATIWLDEKSRPAIVKTGCRPLNYEVLADDRGEPIPLCEIAEGIDEETGADITQEVECRECRNLRIRLEEEEVYAAAWLEGRTLFVDEGASRTDRLRWICNCLFMAGLLKTDAIEAFTKLNEAGFDQRREQVFSLPDLESKVLAIVDGDAQILVGLLDEVDRPTVNQTEKSGRQVAAVFLCTFSCATLQRLASVLKQRGFNPPERWGTDDAIRFAAEMGFPDSYGGSPSHRRDQNLVVDGPMRLEPLHDFQEHVRDSLFGLFEGSGRRRAIILLPTGSGKTRVAVQAAVEAMSKGTIPPKILWVAQSDELCEQAVQCFRQVWWNFGRPFTQLRISRLWGGVGRRMVPDRGPHVVVASIQTLEKRVGDRSFAWLAQAGAVFIDEAHHAITKTYTRVLHWLDETRENEPPIIGLTATAFRGFNEEQSRALIRRFDSLVFPVDIEQAILVRELQRRGILSNAHFDTIESMVQLQFTPEEVAHIETFGEIPDSALMRLIASKDRNERIIQAVLALSPTCRLLLFAINVEHARRLAAALTARGRKAAAIHAGTPSVIRRQLIRDYDSGEIPTLVNYGVLTTGFDAPKTAVIMVARPTFSPNLYQQMIGRGLRGEKNGGTPEGRVITVQDNLELFGERLVFEHFRQMYAND
jgi:superfamily II DNA or RNA helicase